MPTRTAKDTAILIRCEPALLKKIRKLAAEHERSVSAEVRHLMREAVLKGGR